MTKLSSVALAASFVAAISVLGPERAHADADATPARPVLTLQPSAGVLPKFAFTNVKGAIKVGAAPMPGAPLTGWNCDDLVVSVESKEHNPPVPDTFSSPKWRRSAKATGSWASGTCSFSINVVPNSAFFLTVGPTGKDYPCDTISGISITPYSSPAMTVPKGMTKTLPDYTAVGQPTCHIVP